MITHLFIMAIALGNSHAAEGGAERSIEDINPYVPKKTLKRTEVSEDESPKGLKRTKADHGVLHLNLKDLKPKLGELLEEPGAPRLIKKDKK